MAVREAYVNAYGGLSALDIPIWLENAEHMYFSLLEQSRPENSAASRIVLLREAITHAQHSQPSIAPETIAELQAKLGFSLIAVQSSNRPEALEAAIQAYEAALQTYTLDRYPREYAAAQHNLGTVYQERVKGSRRDNLEFAINHYREALRVRTFEDFPYEYSRTQHNFGNTYMQRVDGNRRDNLEYAIQAYREALKVQTLEIYPHDYAMVQFNLGTAYRHRIAGNKYDNLEEALTCLRNALGIRTLDAFRYEYGITQNALGLVYHERLAGIRRDNLEKAIASFKEGLRACTLDSFPYMYAAIQSNLGNTYCDRIDGNKRDNLEEALRCYREALSIYTLNDVPIEHRETQLNLAQLAANSLVALAEEDKDEEGVRDAYTQAHEAYMAARRAQAELGWLESDEQGRASLQKHHVVVKEMYSCDAWCLWQLGDLPSAAVAAEAGRVQALIEAQVIAGATFDSVCSTHIHDFILARQNLQAARAEDDRAKMRAARDAFLATRKQIRAHCQPDFLPDEPEYRDIARAAEVNQAIIYLIANDRGGLAIVVPPANALHHIEEYTPLAFSLPRLTWEAVSNWLVRTDSNGWIVGGYRIALDHKGVQLFAQWIEQGGSASEQERRRALPLRQVMTEIQETFITLRQALQNVIRAWQAEAERLARGDLTQQARAREIRNRLDSPLGELMQKRFFASKLNWYLKQAELDHLLSVMSDAFVGDLRRLLVKHGLGKPDQPIALIPCGRLGVLPIHAAWIPRDSHNGTLIPFAETCELTYQPSARTLAASRAALTQLPANGPVIAVGDPKLPQGSKVPQLAWARVEAEAIFALAQKAQRTGNRKIIGEEATLKSIIQELEEVRSTRTGAWVHVASHGRADPSDPNSCYMLLAQGEALSLARLQRERLLDGVRLFNASGCVTALGDVETAPDELGSFSAGLLQAGASCALAMLWAVSDRATFLLMLRFAQYFLGNPSMTPARALREAVRWLRTAHLADIEALESIELDGLKPILLNETGQERDVLRGDIADIERMVVMEESDPSPITSSADVPPYSHPVYWAASVVYGV